MEITIVLLLIVLHGFFVLGKSALITAKRAKLESEKAAGSRSAVTAVALLDNSDMFLLAMQIGITLLSIVEGTYAGLKLGGWAIPLVADVPSLAPYAGSISLVLVISLIACLALVVGELAPKYIAVQHSESITLAFAPFLNFFDSSANSAPPDEPMTIAPEPRAKSATMLRAASVGRFVLSRTRRPRVARRTTFIPAPAARGTCSTFSSSSSPA